MTCVFLANNYEGGSSCRGFNVNACWVKLKKRRFYLIAMASRFDKMSVGEKKSIVITIFKALIIDYSVTIVPE